MGTPVNERVQKRREALRALGLRPVQLWLPDTRDAKVREAFAEAARQINEVDKSDSWVFEMMDETWQETLGEIDELERQTKDGQQTLK